MENYKITQNEINENNVKSAADLLKGEPRDNKNIFDRLPELIAAKVNGFIDAVISKFADYYNKTEIDGKETALSDRINAKANSVDVYAKSETYTKAETDEAIAQRVTDIGAGDMAKAVYDTDGNGVVDKAETAENAANAEKLNGQPASYYATKTEVQTAQTTADNAIARLDDMDMELLWKNASPTSNFGEQTINLTLSDGDLLFIPFDSFKQQRDFCLFVVKNGKICLVGQTIYNFYRMFEISLTGIKFYKANASNDNVDKDILVPTHIYRIARGLPV